MFWRNKLAKLEDEIANAILWEIFSTIPPTVADILGDILL